MITSIQIVVTASGEQFSPVRAEAQLKRRFVERNEPGETGLRGKFQGLPIPYGYGQLEFDVGQDDGSLIPMRCDLFEDLALVDVLRAHGATDLSAHINIAHDGQCNFELRSESLAALAALGMTIAFSCYPAQEGPGNTETG